MTARHSIPDVIRLARQHCLLSLWTVFCLPTPDMAVAEDAPPRPGLTAIAQEQASDIDPVEAKLVAGLKAPLLAGKNVETALAAWFEGREATERQDQAAATAAWKRGSEALTGLENLPKAVWPAPLGTDLAVLQHISSPGVPDVECHVVSWSVDSLQQYGVFMAPKSGDPDRCYPLILYLHGAAFGVPTHALPWLAQISRKGYAIIGPALRGEPLFSTYGQLPRELDYRCEGDIENLDGEVDDALTAVAGAMKLKRVQKGKFAIVAHSFGAGVGLLTAARSPTAACVVSYDAWLVDPFRHYWDRMRRGANNWWSWESYCNQPVLEQLAGLMHRSVLHHADLLRCPLLLFIGGGYQGSVFHLSHQDLVDRLTSLERDVTYDIVPGGGHTFVLAYDSPAARYALEQQTHFLNKHFPPSAATASPTEGERTSPSPASADRAAGPASAAKAIQDSSAP